jgi:hypothetical protein
VTKSIKVRKPKLKGPVQTGVAWYRPWQWERLLELAADAESLSTTYGEWLDTAQKKTLDLNRTGIFPVKVDVDVEELAAWCKQKGLPLDGHARAGFVLDKIRKREYIRE